MNKKIYVILLFIMSFCLSYSDDGYDYLYDIQCDNECEDYFKEITENQEEYLRFLNKRNINLRKEEGYYYEHDDIHAITEYSLHFPKDTKYQFLMYFKAFDKTSGYELINKNLSVHRKEALEALLDTEFLNMLYSNLPIRMKNKKKFLYGKVSSIGYVTKSLDILLKLELYFINSDNTLETKVFFKPVSLSSLLRKHTDEKEKSKDGFDLSSRNPKDMVTLITENEVVHKTSEHLESTEKELYDLVMRTFKNEIPKEYFEYRDKVYLDGK